MRVVITGPPCSGKSSLIDALRENQADPNTESRGFTFVPEVARETFSFLKEYEPEKVADKAMFQPLFETLQLKNWSENDNAVFDRGLPDEFAYRIHFGSTENTVLWNKCMKYRYDKVFFLPYWPEIYKQDSIRTEDAEEAKRLDTLTWHAYNACCYKIINVPKASVEERVQFILSNL